MHVGMALLVGLLAVVMAFQGGQAFASEVSHLGMVRIPSGSYVPFFLQPPSKGAPSPTAAGPAREPVQVKSFWMDRTPVSNARFQRFLKAHPEWRRSRIPQVFADEHYLKDWKNDLDPPARAGSPVVGVSWFAAHAYCRDQGKELPTIDQWEYVADDHGRGRAAAAPVILAWYAKPNSSALPLVGTKTSENSYGVENLHGLIWEWTLDFNSAMVTEESRENGTRDLNLFCGNGAQGALDPADYATFMRYSFRNSLKASYTTGNLGFRCVSHENEKAGK